MTDSYDDDVLPLHLVLCPGISLDELRAVHLRGERYWKGLPILPPGNEVQIIQLRGRWEPEIEDES